MVQRGCLHILLVENTSSDARLLKELLESVMQLPCALVTVPTLNEALVALGCTPFDVALLDARPPDSQTPATLEQLRQAAPALPIVVVTDQDDDPAAPAAVRHGVQKYVVKGCFDAASLVHVIRRAIDPQRSAEVVQAGEE
jgi:CheY-like chemotaxis protein